MKEEDIQALNIIKKHIRHFKNPVDKSECISIYIYKNTASEDFNFLLNWIKKVEKERRWKL